MNKKIIIPLSENDLQELQEGKTFDWTFDDVDVHIMRECDNQDDNGNACYDCENGNPCGSTKEEYE